MSCIRFLASLGVLVASAAFAAKPVLRVNGVEVTDVDLTMAERAVGGQMAQQGLQPTQDILLRHGVDQLIGKLLLLEAARDAKVTADPKAVAASIDEQRKQLGGAEGMAKALAQAGITEQDLARIATEQLTIQAYVQKVLATQTTATDQEVRGYYDQHPSEFQHTEQLKVRMMFVQVPPTAPQTAQDAAKTKAEAAHKRVTGGEEFSKVATEVSDDPSKSRGGEVGWVRQGLLLKELEAPVWALKTGETSGVLKTQYGYFVFKVEDRRPAGTTSYDEVKENLTSYLKNKKLDESLRGVVADRRAKAKIEVLDPAVKPALEPPTQPAPAVQAAPKAPSGPAKQSSPAATPAPDAPKKP
jgi:parvulin-like peptidyl-prolyl isomerase